MKENTRKYFKESPYCDGCGRVPCTLQKEKDSLLNGLEIKSCSDWTSKNINKIRTFRPKELQPHRTQAVHFNLNQVSACGISQGMMCFDIKLTNNKNEVTCLRCKRSI